MNKALAALPLILLAAPAAAPASQPLALPAFRSVELQGGGELVVRHGPVQRVTLVRGSDQVSDFSVDREGRLTIRACRTSCRDYRLRVEIETPRLEAAAIRGGGSIEAQGRFPAQRSFAAAVTGGGRADVRALGGDSVAAAVRGGGQILTRPRASLAASVSGGGAITYWGDPKVVRSVSGGGSVSQAR